MHVTQASTMVNNKTIKQVKTHRETQRRHWPTAKFRVVAAYVADYPLGTVDKLARIKRFCRVWLDDNVAT